MNDEIEYYRKCFRENDYYLYQNKLYRIKEINNNQESNVAFYRTHINKINMSKKIMFNDHFGLTKAVLEGKKTMTRRIINPQPTYDTLKGMYWKGGYYGIGFDNPNDAYKNFISGTEHNKSCNRYRVGEVITIAQSYKTVYHENILNTKCTDLIYKFNSPGWTNKMFVSADLMPYAIKITDVKVERLQDITDEECLKEGIESFSAFGKPESYIFTDNKNKIYPKGWCTKPREAFALLIDKVSGKGTWDSNPWVYAYSFEIINNPNY